MTTKICALCATYNRPKHLGQMVAMFLSQDHPNKELLILDDANQYGDLPWNQRCGDGWFIISVPERILSVGAKRNLLAKLTNAPFLATFDDDDWYLPWHLSAVSSALECAPWAQPRQSLEWETNTTLSRHWVYGEPVRAQLDEHQNPTTWQQAYDCCYGGQWAYRRDKFLAIGGFPERLGNGDDTEWCRAMFNKHGPSANSITTQHPNPAYVYSRNQSGSWHASELGPGAAPLKRLEAMPRQPLSLFKVELPSNYHAVQIPRDTRPRRW